MAVANSKIDELTAAVGRLEQSNTAVREEVRSLLGSPWAAELRKERLMLEQVCASDLLLLPPYAPLSPPD